MVIKESKLRSIIREYVRGIISEGYSSRERQEEIVAIAREIYNAIIEQGQSTYDTSLKTKNDESSWSVTNVHAIKSKWENAYANRGGITIEVTAETELNTIAKLLMHEFTHIFDMKKDIETGFNGGTSIYGGLSALYDMPEGVKDIIYHLWIPTEFNALQTTYDFNYNNFNDMFETFMGYIEEANNVPDDSMGWSYVRNCLRNNIPTRYQNCSKSAFKRYFISRSMDLMKKLVKKWNGEQNTKFV